MINLLDNTPNQPSKFRTKNWVEINYGSYAIYNTGSQTKLKTSMIVTLIYLLKELYWSQTQEQ